MELRVRRWRRRESENLITTRWRLKMEPIPLLLLTVALAAHASITYSQTTDTKSSATSSKREVRPILSGHPANRAIAQDAPLPAYPQDALEQNVSGQVDLKLRIDIEGYPLELQSMTSTPRNIEFEAAIKPLLSHWRFKTSWVHCEPIETIGNVRVLFEIKDGKGSVRLSDDNLRDPPRTGEVSKHPPVLANMAEVRSNIWMPRRARVERNAVGQIYASVTVDTRIGEVVAVDITHKSARPSSLADDFAAEVLRALKALKANKGPDVDYLMAVCVPFVFGIGGV